MGILDYIRSRMEDGDPEFDLDWEIAREMANDHAEARFAAKKPTLSASAGNANLSMTKRSTGTGESVASSRSISQTGGAAQARFSVGGIYTGSAADYANRSRQGGVDDGPSLIRVGTGEGSQVYGWGLYGSTVRGVAEGYAVFLGAFAYKNEICPVRIQVVQKNRIKKLDSIDVLKSLNTKIGKVNAPGKSDLTREAPSALAEFGKIDAPDKSDLTREAPSALAKISIANLIDIAQHFHPAIFSRDVADALNVTYRGKEINARFAIGGFHGALESVKKGNETIINFYSDRKTENGGQRPHPVLTTASKEIVSQNDANSQESKWTDGVARFSARPAVSALAKAKVGESVK